MNFRYFFLIYFLFPILILSTFGARAADSDGAEDDCVGVLVGYGRLSKFQVPAGKQRLYNGVLGETKDSSLLFGISPYLGGHEGVRRRIEKTFGPIVRYRWLGELATNNPKSTLAFPEITTINETAGLYAELLRKKKPVDSIPSITVDNSADALYRALKRFQPALLATEVVRIPFDKKTEHLDPRLNAISLETGKNVRHEARNRFNLLQLLLFLAKQDSEPVFVLPDDAVPAVKTLKAYLEIMKDMGSFSTRFAKLLSLSNDLLETRQLTKSQYTEMEKLLRTNFFVRLDYYERQALVFLVNGKVRSRSP